MNRRCFSTAVRILSHENPLGLPKTGTPPTLTSRRGLPEKRRIPSVGKVLAVASAKGGVGKSTVAANLALSLARRGLRTGLLDTDLHGPSIPTLFNLLDAGPPRLSPSNQLIPLTNYGVKTMSMGYLVSQSGPLAWRGLLIQRALQQLLHEVEWGGLDVLLLDLPPGTGDVSLTICQQVELDGAVLVSTPSALSLADVRRGASLFGKMDVRVLGVVQNMASFRCPCCGEETEVFGAPTGQKAKLRADCEREGIEILADVPLDAGICEMGDAGKPSVVGEPEGRGAKVFEELAGKVIAKLGL